MKIREAEKLAVALSTMTEIKGVVGYKIARNLRMINDELQEYYQFKEELFKKYGREEDGQLIVDKESKNFLKFMNELEQLVEQEVNFNFRMIKEDELAESGLTSGQMNLIWDIVEE